MWNSVFEVEAIPPYDFLSTVTQWGVQPPLEYFRDGTYYWATRLSPNTVVTLTSESVGNVENPRIRLSLHAEAPLTNKEEEEALDGVRWVLGLDEDITEFYKIAENDPILHSVRKNLYGMRVCASGSMFYAVALAIALQNAPVSRSRQMLRLLTERFGIEGPTVAGLNLYAFPSEEIIAEASNDELIGCKWGYRVDRLRTAASVIREKELTIIKMRKYPTEEVKAILCNIKGVGEYSAEIVALDALRKYDVFPLDSWSSRIFSSLYFGDKDVTINRLRGFAEREWGRYRGLAFVYVLNDLDKLSERLGIKIV